MPANCLEKRNSRQVCCLLFVATALNLVFKGFSQASIPLLISALYAKKYHDLSLKKFCLTVPQNFVEEPFCVSENFWYRKMLRIGERERGHHDSPLKKLLSHSTEKPHSGTLLCFRKFLVSKNVKYKRGGNYYDVPSKLFCLTVSKIFVRGTFLVSEKLWYRSFSCIIGGSVSRFSVVIF